jgi:hypothetical protein
VPRFPRFLGDIAVRRQTRAIADLVNQHGWAIADIDGDAPFAYTAGLGRLLSHPELIVTGMPGSVAGPILHAAVRRIRDGHALRPGQRANGLIGVYDAIVVPVGRDQLGMLAFARDYWLDGEVQAVQVVWPDRGGRFPWDEDAAPGFAANQPLLGAHVTLTDAG